MNEIVPYKNFDIQRVGDDELRVDSVFGSLRITKNLLVSILLHKEKIISDTVLSLINEGGKLNELKLGILEFLYQEEDDIEYEIETETNYSFHCVIKDYIHQLGIRSMDYVPLNRTGQSSLQLTIQFYHILLTASNPFEVGPILAKEITRNDSEFQLDEQTVFLFQEFAYYIESSNPEEAFSGYSMLSYALSNFINLMLSGQFLISVGLIQGQGKQLNEYGFVLYANITGHILESFKDLCRLRNFDGDINYFRIFLKFVDRYKPHHLYKEGHPEQQLLIKSILPEDPTSTRLAKSILPAGIGPAPNYDILGTEIGTFPDRNDENIISSRIISLPFPDYNTPPIVLSPIILETPSVDAPVPKEFQQK